MANTREPILQPIPILSLRPTQMTVGMREVKEKRQRWREHKSKKKQAELLGKHMIPVVLGPDKRHYVVDHHHLARALHDEGVKDILVTRDRRPHHGRPRRVLGRARQPAMGLSLRRQGRAPALQGLAENGDRAQGRSVPQPRRRIAPRRRLRQGHHAVQRISVGGFSAPADCRARAWRPISTRRSRRRWRWPRARTRSICPAGADRRRTISGG